MQKPLFRWTVGPCLQQGLDILAESINRTTKAFGPDKFDWMVCYNGLNKQDIDFLHGVVGDRPIRFHCQDWSTCPVMDNCQTPRRKDGSFEYNGNRCGGTMWKVCPPRLRMETHEIVMDNDVVLLKALPQIDQWLARTDTVLLLEEPIRFYGRYDCLFGPNPPYFNSGLMGYPPGYDFGAAIFANWEKHGRYMNISQSDEQGLLTYSLSRQSSIRIHPNQIVEVLRSDYKTELTGRETGIHFTQANRCPNHHSWKKYQELIKNSTMI